MRILLTGDFLLVSPELALLWNLGALVPGGVLAEQFLKFNFQSNL